MMNRTIPSFLTSYDRDDASNLKKLTAIVATLFLAIWLTFPLICEPPDKPIRIHLISKFGQKCSDWDPILAGKASPVTVVDCIQFGIGDPDPTKAFKEFMSFQTFMLPGEGIGVLDDTRSACGDGEARFRGQRYFLIACSSISSTFNSYSWSHEGFHLSLGHSALRYTFLKVLFFLPTPFSDYAQEALNSFLDTAYVNPAQAFGQHALVMMRLSVIGFSLICWSFLWWQKRRRRTSNF
jgi:hypothetical protein